MTDERLAESPTGTSPERVLLVGEYGTCNGGEHSLLAILPFLQSSSRLFEALVPTPSAFSEHLQALRIATHNFDPGSGSTRKSQEEIRAAIRTTIQKVSPDLIHANSLSASRLCGPVTKELGVRAIGHLRDIMKLSQQAIRDLNELDGMVAVSNATRDFHVKQGLQQEKVAVVYNGIDLAKFHPIENEAARATVRGALGVGEHEPLLLFVGQIGMRKGVDTLLDAISLLRVEFPSATVAIVGARHSEKEEAISYERELRKRADQIGGIRWLGRRDDVAGWMRAATMLVHPARQEPLGRVLLEALASGLPIVATNVGGTREILTGELGDQWLCEPNDPTRLAALAGRLLRSQQLRVTLGQQMRKIAESRFTHEHCAAAIERIYTNCEST